MATPATTVAICLISIALLYGIDGSAYEPFMYKDVDRHRKVPRNVSRARRHPPSIEPTRRLFGRDSALSTPQDVRHAAKPLSPGGNSCRATLDAPFWGVTTAYTTTAGCVFQKPVVCSKAWASCNTPKSSW